VVNLNVFGGEGSLCTDSERPEARLFVPSLADGQSGPAAIPFAPLVGHPVLAELSHFVECIRTGREPLVNVEDGTRTTAVLAAIQRSLEAGEPAPVEDVERPMTGDDQLMMRCTDLTNVAEPALPAGYSLRAYRPGDTRGWLDICNPAIGTTWTDADFGEKMLNAPWFSPDRVFMVEHGGEPVGTASAWQENAVQRKVGYTHMVAIRPDHRGRGLGRALMRQVMRWFHEHGFRESILHTDDFRLPAIALYLSLGFEPLVRDDFHRRRWAAVEVALGAIARRAEIGD
jgi:mycothiol synthase